MLLQNIQYKGETMFTGIIEEVGKIKEIKRDGMSLRLAILCKDVLEGTKKGDSIAVNGICLTVAGIGPGVIYADVMPETFRRTGFDRLSNGSAVNLERALRLSDRLGGHIVSGHIDGTGIIRRKTKEDNSLWFSIEAPDDILKYIAVKGSVAIDGISLTVAFVEKNLFGVSIIPHTASATTLGEKKEGDIVNIECDIIGKYVEKLLNETKIRGAAPKKDMGLNFLKQNGFA